MTYTKPIYLDYQSTTPMDPRVLDAMLPYFTEHFGNPHSRTHSYGWSAEVAVEQARQKLANVLGADPREIIFTSGATEANNLAIKGLAAFHQKRPIHIITTVTEHKCVLDACRHLSEAGVEITYLPVQQNGILDLSDLKEAFRENTILVSVMAVNNEIGVIQPIETIGAMCRERGVLFHCDAAQGFGKIPLDVERMCIDLLSISGHKIYGPKGIGALYVRRKPRVRLTPLMNGGGQERGLRSGTIPTPLVVGLGEAAVLSHTSMETEHRMLKGYFDDFVGRIQQAIPDVYLNGDAVQRWPGNVNLSFAYVEGESMLMAIKALAVSSGSACTSASLEPSYVLRALGVREELAHTSIRFGFGRFTTQAEIDQAVDLILCNVERLRQMSPLWEMVQDGIDLTTIQWSGH